MSTIFRTALVAVALIASASASMAAPRHHHNSGVQTYSGSTDADRAYWDAEQRNGN
jgi:hypothetical protein